MSLDAPLGLLTLAAVLPLVLAYFLRRRQKPRVVSALFLWQAPSRRAQAGPRLHRFSREASFLVEVAAIVSAALFLSNLRIGKEQARKHAVVVLDGSLSMLAKAGNETAAERAVRHLALALSEEAADVVTVVESGPHPRVIVGPLADAASLAASLSSWRPSQPAHDFAPALMLARELSTSKGQRIRLLTDGPASGDQAWPDDVEVWSAGVAMDNVAFLSAQRLDVDGNAQVILRIANFGKDRQSVPIVLANDEVQQRETVELEAGASAVVRLAVPTRLSLTASLPRDALPADSQIVLPPAPVRPVPIGMQSGLDPASESSLRRLLAVMPGLLVSSEPTLTFGPPGTDAGVTIGAKGRLRSFVGPFFLEKADPLLEDVHLTGAVWSAGDNPPGRPLISMGDAAMLTLEGADRVHINIDVSRSNVQRTAAWPVLVGNIVRAARLRVPGFSRNLVMLGENAEAALSSKGRWELETPSGSRRMLYGAGPVRLPIAEGGEWKLLHDGVIVDSLVVLPLDARESDLRTRGKYEVHARASMGTTPKPDSRRPRWLLGLLFALLLLDFWLTHDPGLEPHAVRSA